MTKYVTGQSSSRADLQPVTFQIFDRKSMRANMQRRIKSLQISSKHWMDMPSEATSHSIITALE